MNRIINIGPIIIFAAPLAALLLLLGIDKLSARGGKPWVKLALAVNTCLLLLSGAVIGGNAHAQGEDTVDCYDIDVLPDPVYQKFWENRSHPSFKELVRLDSKLTNAINSGKYNDGLYDSIRQQVEKNIEILQKDNEISSGEAAEIRSYFGERLDVYMFEVGGVTCYFFG